MPSEVTPLFRPEVVRPRLTDFQLPARAIEARERLGRWVKLLDSPHGQRKTESELLPDYITDIFGRVLGYLGPADSDNGYTLSRERHVEVDGKVADGVLGWFGEGTEKFIVAVEGKGPGAPLDRPHGGRRMSAVDQVYRYAINLPCDWALVTNLREIRLYHKGSTQRSFERFRIDDLAADEQEFRRFVFVLGAERVVPEEGRSHLYNLLEASERAGNELTQEFYGVYADIRHDLLQALLQANPESSPKNVLTAAQRLLDRSLFVAFAEDRGLLPPGLLQMTYEHRDPFHPRPVWKNFVALFRSIDEGNDALGVPRYNGGLFAEHPLIDQELEVPDHACQLLRRLGAYDYRAPSQQERNGETRLVDVEILGHIFEQSIEDLEAIQADIAGGEVSRATSRRKREGAFYTPDYITRYIVGETLAPVLKERFEQSHHRFDLGQKHRLRT